MEQASALDERHSSPGYDACSHEFPGLHRNTDEGTGLVNGKAWANTQQAYHLITAVLLQNFCSSGAKTYVELCVYLETAREHPPGRLWVDCPYQTVVAHVPVRRAEW